MTFFPKGWVKALRAEGTVGEAESQREQPVLKRFFLEEQGHIEWPTEMHPSCFGWYAPLGTQRVFQVIKSRRNGRRG